MQKDTFCWVDIPVMDLDRAIEFYSMILNEPVKKIEDHGLVFGLLPHSDDNVSGCLCVMKDRKPSPHGALVYLNVENRLDEALAGAMKYGVGVIKEKEQIGPFGYRAIIYDTEGNTMALYSKEA